MTAKDRLIYKLLSVMVAVLGRLSLDRGRSVSAVLGGIWFSLDRHHRKITVDNLARAYGSTMNRDRVVRLAHRVFANTVRMLFEYAWYYTTGLKNCDRYLSFRGIEHLARAHSRGKGVLCLSGHLGNWEMAVSAVPLTRLPVSAVYRKIKSKPLDAFIYDNRARAGCRLFPLHHALDAVMEALDRGDLVGLLVDQNSGHNKGVFVNFFGRKACSSKGLARLALSTGAPVVPVFIFRENDRYVMEAQPELPLVFTGDENADVRVNTQNYQMAIEKMVRRYPDQWFWIHKRWKTRPLNQD